jgi:beta-glucosidase
MSDEADGYHSAHYVKTSEDAAAVGLNAGCDQEGGGDGATSHLPDAIKNNKTTAAAVATAFRRLFRSRVRMGMFDPPNSVAYNQVGGAQQCVCECECARVYACGGCGVCAIGSARSMRVR